MGAARTGGRGAVRTSARRSRGVVGTAAVAVAAFVAGLSLQGAPADAQSARSTAAFRKVTSATFRVSSFNVLGWSHTAAGGNKARMASGGTYAITAGDSANVPS